MFIQIIPFLIAYFIYTFTRDLIQYEGAFGWAQWVMLALDIAFVVLLYPTGKRAIAAYKQSKEDRAAQMAEEEEKLAKSRQAKYFEDFGDGPGYDDIKPETDDEDNESDEDSGDDEGAQDSSSLTSESESESSEPDDAKN